jgi:8-oxo-dGTP pyrophosphatase MutT (NUDIX family)
MDEYVDIILEDGTVTYQSLKTAAHTNGWLHTTVIAYVRHGKTWKLVRQTPDRQDAGQLVAPVGGHVKAGEPELEALRRETQEEIGIQAFSHNFIGRARYHRQVLGRDENHLFAIYEISPQEEITLGSEADAIEAFTTKQLQHALVTTPERFGEPLYFVFETFYPHMLPASWQKRWS